MDYIWAFIIGGIICAIGQILMDKTSFTPAKILVSFVTVGVILGALNIYDVLIDIGGEGARVPLPGFGYVLAKATIKEVDSQGLIGAFIGGIRGSAGGVAASIVFGYIMALIFNPKTKK